MAFFRFQTPRFFRRVSLLFLGAALLTGTNFVIQADESPVNETPVVETPAAEPPQEIFNARLLRDWIYQDAQTLDIGDYFESADSFEREKAVVEKALSFLEASEKGAFEEELASLTSENVPGKDPRWLNLYRDICQIRRQARLAVIRDYSSTFVFTKHYVMGASHYAYTEDLTDTNYYDVGCNRISGGKLCQVTILPDGSLEEKVLYETADGTLRDPDVSYDGKRVIFSMRKSFDKDDFHLYELNLESGKVRQLTFGAGVADIEPAYLPNGDILFVSSRCSQLIDCWWKEVSNLYVCDADGRFMRRLSHDQVTVNYPKVLEDGRVIYTRWEYNDRGQIFPQPLFVMNADGTGQTEYYGNNSFFPTTILHARGIPGSDKVLAIAAGHHTYQQGKLILIDRNKGTQENEGVTLVAPIRETPAEQIDRYGQEGEHFQYPCPLSENEFLIAYLPEGQQQPAYHVPYGLYAMDLDGHRELLAYDPSVSCGQAVVLGEREIPTLRPSQVDLRKETGRFYVQNIYEGPGLAGVEKGTIKSIRVVALDFRVAGAHENHNAGPYGGAVVSTPISIGNGSWDVKTVLGEVPVESDGSAYFEVPAMTPVYFQLLDENGDMVQTMRSWSTLQPGELFACVGCHEPKDNITANVSLNAATEAIRKTPAQLTPTAHEKGIYQNAGFSYNRDVQPILDHSCVRCHQGGEGKPMDLTGDTQWGKVSEEARRLFNVSYVNLTEGGNKTYKYVNWPDAQGPPTMVPPYFTGAVKSPLIQMLRNPDEIHKGVISNDDLKTLALWIDLAVPFCGDYREANFWDDPQKANYSYFEMKKDVLKKINAQNIQKKIDVEDGKRPLPALADFGQLIGGGLTGKESFIKGYLSRRLPVRTKKSGEANVYRNLALNPEDVQGEPTAYPHASSNTEYAYMADFAAKNVINGKTDNQGHGEYFPSWGPNLRRDPWIKIDLGAPSKVDKVVIWLRADFPHDNIWTNGTLEFSNGFKMDVTFEKTAEPQTFTFDPQEITWVRLTNLSGEKVEEWKGISEFQVWGTSIE